jgi:predicted NAD/FAD-dependent oxidoreductase
MATRYGGGFEFDHGAQFFTARSDAFAAFLAPLVAGGAIASWNARFAELRGAHVTAERAWDERYPHYVGYPRMNAVGKWLSDGLDIRLGRRVSKLCPEKRGWSLEIEGDGTEGRFDWVILTAPAAQTAELAEADRSLRREALGSGMLGCYALMLGFPNTLNLRWQAALVRDADISWISVNSSKPGRRGNDTLVVHSTNAWAEAHLDSDPGDIGRHLLAEASRVTGRDLAVATHVDLQRWRYANIDKQAGATHHIDDHLQLAACGDWFIRGRIEAAFTSATTLAAALDQRLD